MLFRSRRPESTDVPAQTRHLRWPARQVFTPRCALSPGDILAARRVASPDLLSMFGGRRSPPGTLCLIQTATCPLTGVRMAMSRGFRLSCWVCSGNAGGHPCTSVPSCVRPGTSGCLSSGWSGAPPAAAGRPEGMSRGVRVPARRKKGKRLAPSAFRAPAAPSGTDDATASPCARHRNRQTGMHLARVYPNLRKLVLV